MILLRQLTQNVPECVTDLEAGGQPLGLPWRERLAGRPHGARARVVPDQDDPPPRGTGCPTPTGSLGLAACPGVSRPAARLAREHAVEPSPTGLPVGSDAGVYTDWLKRPLGAVSGHLCTLLRLAGSFERPWRRRSVHRSAKMASRGRFGAFVYTVATRFAKAATHTNPRRALLHSNYCIRAGP